MTKEEYQKQNDEMRNDIAAYREIGTPEQIKELLDSRARKIAEVVEEARTTSTTLSMIKKLLRD